MNKGVKIGVGIVVAAVVCYLMPFVTVNTTDPSGKTWRVPFGASFQSDSGDTLTFTSIRSAYALEKDGANALNSYTSSKCYGKTYYYDEENDVSFSGYTTANGIPASISYTYEPGNACAGWTADDEVAWGYGEISEVDSSISIEDAQEEGWFVMQDGKSLNLAVYNDFSRSVKQGVPSYLRTLLLQDDSFQVIDMQLLVDGGYRVQTYDGNETTDVTYSRFSDTEENGIRDVTVTNGGVNSTDSIVLFTVE